jgi:hypothetical protein
VRICASGRSPARTPNHASAIDAAPISSVGTSSARGSRAPAGCACAAFRHLDDEADRRVERGDAHRGAAVVDVEERVLARRDCGGAGSSAAPSMISSRSERTW